MKLIFSFLQVFFMLGWFCFAIDYTYKHQWHDAGIAFGLAYCGAARRPVSQGG